MMVEAASRLNVKTLVLDAAGAPAKQINASAGHVDGSFTDRAAIVQLAERCDVLTVEIEHVDAGILAEVAASHGVEVHPAPATIKLIQNKYEQKKHLMAHDIAVAESIEVAGEGASLVERLRAAGEQLGYPYMLKSQTLAYDGRGNFVVKDAAAVAAVAATLDARPLYAEKWVPFTMELAVMVVRQKSGKLLCYPTVETVQKDNICHLVYGPARGVSDATQIKARYLAERAVATLQGAGIFGVEMFLLPDQSIIINEIAPRPHNSGHYTQDACATSQFEAHVRAVLGLPFPATGTSLVPFATPSTHTIMLNILGTPDKDGELEYCKRALLTPGATVHLYGKQSRPARKMGHVNIVGATMNECEARLRLILTGKLPPDEAKPVAAGPPLVSIIMGSDSDLPVMAVGANLLKTFGVRFELSIVSAHRTPFRMAKYAAEAASRGVKVIIAGAGGAAHLPGMVAAMTSLPVIGVPVKGSSLDGVDSLYSIVQMPRGIPVATVAINNATNAALLAVRILGAFLPEFQLKADQYATQIEAEVMAKVDKLDAVGYEKYKGL
ncbi:AIR carboxylase-domain-containing protein [Dipodascopsis tothii]|uniref:AIR carboxylase-domain-containing protein n=1 Tax=Dipodascopsis tothii TaxID=44089 RepID=UPI0034CD2169